MSEQIIDKFKKFSQKYVEKLEKDQYNNRQIGYTRSLINILIEMLKELTQILNKNERDENDE